MNQPLASAAGNALEVGYVIDYLTGRRREPRFHAVTVALGAEMLTLGGNAADQAAARKRVEEAITSGSAAETFSRMVAELGGPGDLVEQSHRHLARAPIVRAVHPASPGVVQAIATREIGLAVVALGGGRTRPQDAIDHRVGFTNLAGIGQPVDQERPLGLVHAATEAQAGWAAQALLHAYAISDQPSRETPLILERIGGAA
jgi:thymidine phosphorylase